MTQSPHGLGGPRDVDAEQFAAVRLDSSSTPTTNGITSPARRTSTVSPILMPRPGSRSGWPASPS